MCVNDISNGTHISYVCAKSRISIGVGVLHRPPPLKISIKQERVTYMCGITGYVAEKSNPSIDVICNLLRYGELRGSDGFGTLLVGERNNGHVVRRVFRTFSNDIDYETVLGGLYEGLKPGSILLANHRAAPETECQADENNVSKNTQPITDPIEQLILVHNGAVSNFVVNELKEEFNFHTNIDSEAILHAYLKFGRNMKDTMEYLSGGFSFLLYDGKLGALYSVCTHNPLYVGYVKGCGYFYSSIEDAIWDTISKLKGTKIEKNTMNMWEDYYGHRHPEYTIQRIDLQSSMVNTFTFKPRYVTLNYDPYQEKTIDKPVVLVAASGGLDSSTTLATLKAAEMNPIAVHFKYGHRGQECEDLAIEKITEILDVPLVKFDIEENMKLLDKGGMLTDKDAKITTGTDQGLKTTAAWTIFRNHFFVTYMGALAESLMINDKYSNVFITGGFMQLSEEGAYPDNSLRFLDSALKFFKYSITGTRIKPLFGLCNILKTEQYHLLNELGYYEKLGKYLVSCDRPKIIRQSNTVLPANCCKDDKPACGSGLLSYWACKMAGLPDYRTYYKVDDAEYKAYEPNSTLEKKNMNIEKIVNRIQIPSDYKIQLLNKLL